MTDDQLTAVAQCSQPQSHLSTTQCNSALPDPTPAPLEQLTRLVLVPTSCRGISQMSGEIKLPFDSLLSQQHFCQKLSKLATYIEVTEC